MFILSGGLPALSARALPSFCTCPPWASKSLVQNQVFEAQGSHLWWWEILQSPLQGQ